MPFPKTSGVLVWWADRWAGTNIKQEIAYAKTYDFYGTPQEKIPSAKIEMHEKKLKLPTIPEKYVIDKPHYLSIGEGIYVLIKMQKMILMISGLL